MDMNNTLLLILAGLLVLTISSSLVIARTAKSKGYSFGLFFFFAIISYLITAVVTVFVRPKGDTKARPKISSVALLMLGVVVEFIGIGYVPDSKLASESDSEALLAMLNDPQVIGGATIAFAGVLIVIGAVANDYRGAEPKASSKRLPQSRL
jgi:amino acid transporter